jgi:diguanylate cyclase (GGDEF)-like protein
VGQGITGWVAEHGVAQNLGNAAQDARSATIPGTDDDLDESLLVAPMNYDDAVIGVIVLAKLGLNKFSADDLRLLEIYASIAAQAMANADSTERLRAQSERLAQQVANQRELLRVTESILGTLDTQTLLHEIAERLAALLFFDNIGVDVYDQPAGLLRPIFARGTNAADYLGRTMTDQLGVSGYVVRSGEAELIQDELSDPRVAHFDAGPQQGALIAAPLRSRDRVTGLLTVERLGEGARFTDEEFELVKLFAGHVAIALQNAETHRAVEIRAQTDALTGLKNHGALTDHIRLAVGRGDPFALLMLDLDQFKEFNDHSGHEAGNVLLSRLAGVLREACRESDEIFRYGGDEFAIMLPKTSTEGALEVARKVRAAVRQMGGGRRGGGRVSCSVGVAVYPDDAADAGAVLVAADRALYVAKRRGRDGIATAPEGLSLEGEFLPPPTPVDMTGDAYSAA